MAHRRKSLGITVVVAVLLAGSLGLGYWGVSTWALHAADSVTITVRHAVTDPALASPPYTKRVNDATLARALQHWLNDDTAPPKPGYSGLGEDHADNSYSYQFTFTWRGIAIESASTSTLDGGLWRISVLGFSNGGRVNATSLDVYSAILKAMPDLPAPVWARQITSSQ